MIRKRTIWTNNSDVPVTIKGIEFLPGVAVTCGNIFDHQELNDLARFNVTGVEVEISVEETTSIELQRDPDDPGKSGDKQDDSTKHPVSKVLESFQSSSS